MLTDGNEKDCAYQTQIALLTSLVAKRSLKDLRVANLAFFNS